MIEGTLVSILLVGVTVLIHFEFLHFVPRFVERSRLRPRLRVVAMLIGAFAAHTVEVYAYAVAYLVLDRVSLHSDFTGPFHGAFIDYLYFSAVTYTSLGYGDVLPVGPVRLISGTEALNGLILIAWTASVTYLMMERYWRRD